jgi:hypothetical protein
MEKEIGDYIIKDLSKNINLSYNYPISYYIDRFA